MSGILQVVVGLAAPETVPVVPGKLPDKLMMVLRAPGKPYPFHWNLPGGKVEPGESLQDALCREWHEEVACHPTKVDWDNHWVRRFDKPLEGLITPFELHAFWIEKWVSIKHKIAIPEAVEPGTEVAFISTSILRNGHVLMLPWFSEMLEEMELPK